MLRQPFFASVAARCLLVAGLVLTGAAQAQVVAKPARIVVGFPPGGSADLVARALVQAMPGYAPTLIVDNKPGAGGRIAIENVKAADADGSAMLITPSSMVSVYPHVYRKLNYDMGRDFVPVAELASFPFVLVVGSQVPASVRTVADFVSWAKAHPKLASYASPGNGTTPHFVGVMLARESQAPLMHVAYKGGAQAITDVIGGQIASNVAVISNALPHIHARKLRALAGTGAKRRSALPEVPTFAESGYKDIDMTEWFGLFVPGRTPPDVVNKLAAMMRDALKTTGVQEAIAKAGFDAAAPATPAQFATMVKQDSARWGGIVKSTGFTPED